MIIQEKTLRKFMVDAALSIGLIHDHAETVADNLITASLWHVDSHGVSRYPHYFNRLRKGLVNKKPGIKITHPLPAVVKVDGDNGLGSVIMMAAIEDGIKIAKQYGVVMIGVNHSNHFGAAGYYCNYLAEKAFSSVIYTSCPPIMPPFGGMEPYLGTNPLAIGIPCRQRPHIIIDMATSMVAKGKIRELERAGAKTIPEGWALDKDGKPTTDLADAMKGFMIPFGAHKGSALAIAVEYFGGLAPNANFGRDVVSAYGDDPTPPGVGHFVTIYDVAAFMSREDYYARTDKFYNELKNIRPAAGFDSVILPGEREFDFEKKQIEVGIELTTSLCEQFMEVSKLTGIPFPE
jgi:LDH2 family malate/lactate/ureidoglycolate dehydrogenase